MESKIVLNQKTNNITITNAPTGTSQLSSTKNGTLSIIGGSTAIVNALIEKHNLDKEAHKKELYAQLDYIDSKSIRSIRAKEAGTATQDDLDKLEELELQAAQIRRELKELDESL